MKTGLLFIVLPVFLLYTESAVITNEKKCPVIKVHGKTYRREVLANGINRPYQLASYHHGEHHKVFFSYNVGGNDKDQFEIGYVTKPDQLPTPINAVKNGFATALDEENKLLYLGGSEGIFVLNLTNSNDVKHIVKGHDIWDMFYKDHLYFISYPSQRLYKKTHNSSELVEHITETIYQFVIDGRNNIFITTKGGLHEIKNGTNERVPYEGPKQFRAMEVDRKGTAHFCAGSSIYVAGENQTLKEIAYVKNVFGLTFDESNNIIYSDPHEIVVVLPGKC